MISSIFFGPVAVMLQGAIAAPIAQLAPVAQPEPQPVPAVQDVTVRLIRNFACRHDSIDY